MSMPPAITAIVPLSIDPIWAAVSTPRARPDDDGHVFPVPSSTASCRAKRRRRRRRKALRAPTIAIVRAAGQADIAADHRGGRGIVEFGEQGRIVGVVDEEVACAELRRYGQFAFGRGRRCDGRRLSAAPRRQPGQRLDRRRRVAEHVRPAGDR